MAGADGDRPCAQDSLGAMTVFCRTLGQTVDVTVAAVVFQNRVQMKIGNIPGLEHFDVTDVLFSPPITPGNRVAIAQAFADALKTVWEVGIGLAVAAFATSLLIKAIPLSSDMQAEQGWRRDDKVARETA